MPPSITFPLTTVPGQSPVRKQANVRLELRTRGGVWKPVGFRVDTGATLTTMSLPQAEPPTNLNPDGLDLATTYEERRIDRSLADGSTQRGVRMLLGTLTARFPELPAFVFRWECLFDPTLPRTQAPLLGIGGRVLSDLTVTFRGPERDYFVGSVTFDVLARPVPLFPPSDPLVRECRYEPTRWPVPSQAPNLPPSP